MPNELKPCPFCGTSGIDAHLCRKFVRDVAHFYVTCEFCGASTGLYFVEEKAILAWNVRVNNEKN